MNEIIDYLTNEITKAHDDYVYAQFERFGYSRENVNELGRQGRLKVIVMPMSKTFCVDDIQLFKIEQHESGFDPNCTKWISKMRCIDLKEPIKKGEITDDNN